MFQLVGLGEQAGSGIPKIYAAWRGQSWRSPSLEERDQPSDQTILALRPVSLLPPEVVAELERRIGEPFRRLSEFRRLALITAATEGEVTNRRLQAVSDKHPRDITSELAGLVADGYLTQHGITSGTAYRLAGATSATSADALFDDRALITSSDHSGGSMDHSASLAAAGAAAQEHPREVSLVQSSLRASQDAVCAAIVAVCQPDWLDLAQIAATLRRREPTVRRYVRRLVREGRLALRYPASPTHPQQAYRRADYETRDA